MADTAILFQSFWIETTIFASTAVSSWFVLSQNFKVFDSWLEVKISRKEQMR